MSRLMMGVKIFLLFVFCAAGVKGQENPLGRCLKMIKYENGVDTFMKLADEEQFNVTCVNTRKFINCMNDVAREKFGSDVKELAIVLQGTDVGKAFQLLSNMIDLIEELCSEHTQLHKDYMMDIQCVRHLNRDALDRCKREALAASVIFRHMDMEDSFDHSLDEPCVITAYQLGCLGADILEECGDRAFNTYKEIIRKIGFFKLGICPKDIIQAVNTTIIDSLEQLESRKNVYHTILALKKRRK